MWHRRTEYKHGVFCFRCFKNNGRITFEGKIKDKDNEPVIVIGFENNKDGYNNIKKQTKMMNQAFEALQNKYNFNNFILFWLFISNIFYPF